MSKRRVVVTGMGMISPLGNNVSDSWENVLLIADQDNTSVKVNGQNYVTLNEGQFTIIEGDKYASNGTMYVSTENKSDKIFPVSIIKSDYIIIEVSIPAEEIDIVRLNLSSIIHDYTDIMGYYSSEDSNREDCNINVACPEGIPYEDQINSAAHLDMNGYICSGAMINNTANDLTPYFFSKTSCMFLQNL